jgi:hypothetical protein
MIQSVQFIKNTASFGLPAQYSSLLAAQVVVSCTTLLYPALGIVVYSVVIH